MDSPEEAVLNAKGEKALLSVLMEIKVGPAIRIQSNNHSAGKILILFYFNSFLRNANEVYRMSKVSGYSGVTSHNS
jgi:hypothetical protein